MACELLKKKKKEKKDNFLFTSGNSDTSKNMNFLDNSQVFHRMLSEYPSSPQVRQSLPVVEM